MTNLSTIENKISSVRKYIRILKRYRKFSIKQIEDDVDIRGMVERYLYLAIQSNIDLAEAVISLRKLRKPTSLSENFYILSEEEIISNELTEKMTKLVGLRNVLAHQYGKVNYDIVYDVLHKRLKDIIEFLEIIKSLIK